VIEVKCGCRSEIEKGGKGVDEGRDGGMKYKLSGTLVMCGSDQVFQYYVRN